MLTFRKKFILYECFFLICYSLPICLYFGIKPLLFFILVKMVCGILFLYYITRPFKRFVDSISFLKEGELPTIPFSTSDDESTKIGAFLNGLIEKIQKQIEGLQAQKKETEEILYSLDEGVIAVDIEGKVTFVNGSAYKMLGFASNLLIGKQLQDIPTNPQDLSLICHELIQEVLQTSEVAIQNWNNEKVYFHIAVSPKARHNGAILVIQDKTKDYKMVEVGKAFIANASHELRTPITVIRGFAETLQDHPTLSPTILQDIGHKIVRTSSRLETLIKSLLTLADIENLLPEKFQKVDLVGLAEQCRNLLITRYPHVNLEFITQRYNVSVMGDPFLLELAIMNLLENAVRYSSLPHSISLTIRVGKEAQLEVKDQGIGIPKEDLPHIFERFYTVDKARSRKSGGSGLGLAIVKVIIEKHSGVISVASELTKGSSFTLGLPLKT